MSSEVEKHLKEASFKSVGKALSILSLFSRETPMLRTSDVAVRLDMNLSTVSRHLNTLLDWGFLQRDDITGCYSPGLQIVALAGIALQNSEVYRHSYAELSRISFRYNIHSHMSIP